MQKIKILHCADLHIGAAQSFLGTLSEKRRYETLITFENIVDKAINEEVDIVAVAGDLFDSNNIEKSFTEAVFNKISSAQNIKFVVSCGNHDPLDSTSPFWEATLPSNLFVLNTKDDMIRFDDLHTRVYGKSFASCYQMGSEVFSLVPENDDYINLMVIHGELKSDLNSDYNAITPSFIKNSGMDYIALGHVHKRTDIGKIENTHFAYCGCSEGQGFDELGDKGVYIGTIQKGMCELKFVSIAKRMHIHEKICIGELLSAEQITEKIISELAEKYGADFSENLYKIELTGEIDEGISLPVSEIISRLSERVFFAKVKDSTKLSFDLNALVNEPTLKGIFVKNMLKRIETAEGQEKIALERALEIGLKAFLGEVNWNEN